jgi:hypothetical protein
MHHIFDAGHNTFFPHTSTIPKGTFHLKRDGLFFALTTLPGFWADLLSVIVSTLDLLRVLGLEQTTTGFFLADLFFYFQQ